METNAHGKKIRVQTKIGIAKSNVYGKVQKGSWITKSLSIYHVHKKIIM
jgi:hypothetical protein